MRHRTVVVGSSFAGLTAALELKHHLGDSHDVVVVSKSEEFVFLPSLVWVPFGLRNRADLTFAVGPVLEKKGVLFRQGEVLSIDLDARCLHLRPIDTPPGWRPTDAPAAPSARSIDEGGEVALEYDTLVIATGPALAYDELPGLGPHRGFTTSIFTLDEAVAAQRTFARLLENPGPVVIGAAPGASHVSVAYEFLFNLVHQLRRRHMEDKVPLTLLTPEPYVGHLGMGGLGRMAALLEDMLSKAGVSLQTDAAITRIDAAKVRLDSGEALPFRMAMIVPAFRGVPPVRALTSIATPSGFVRVQPTYCTEAYPEVFACGAAVHLDPPDVTRVPLGVPRTGYLSEEMARVVAYNVAARIQGRRPVAMPPASIDAKYVLDAGNEGLILSADHFLEPRDHAWVIPGPEAHWAKVAFERYFMATRRHGRV